MESLNILIKTVNSEKKFVIHKNDVPNTDNYFTQLFKNKLTVPVKKENNCFIFDWTKLNPHESFLNIENFENMVEFFTNKTINDMPNLMHMLTYFMIYLDNTEYNIIITQEDYIRKNVYKILKYPVYTRIDSEKCDIYFKMLKFYDVEYSLFNKDIVCTNVFRLFKLSKTKFYFYKIKKIIDKVNNHYFINFKTEFEKRVSNQLRCILQHPSVNTLLFSKFYSENADYDKIGQSLLVLDMLSEASHLFFSLVSKESIIPFVPIKHKEEIIKYKKQPHKLINKIPLKLQQILPFENSDWNNMLLAGGAACTLFLHKSTSNIKDYDLFFYGLNDVELNKKLTRILSLYKIQDNNVLFERSKYVVTIYTWINLQMYTIQIILKQYQTCEEILYSFDVDSSCIGYNGLNFVYTRRFIYAYTYMMNTVNFDRLSTTYEYRLFKYLNRGFSIYIPDFDMKNINYENIKIIHNRIILDKITKFFSSIHRPYEPSHDYVHVLKYIEQKHKKRIAIWYTNNSLNLEVFENRFIKGIDIILYNYFIKRYLMPSDYELQKNTHKYTKHNIDANIEYAYDRLKQKHEKIFISKNNLSYFTKLVEYVIQTRDCTAIVDDCIEWNKHNILKNTINPHNKINLQDTSSWYKGLFYNVDSKLYNELQIDTMKTLSTSDIVLLNLMNKYNNKFNEIDIKFPKLSETQLQEIIASPDMDKYQINDS